MELPRDLREALDAAAAGLDLHTAVDRLIETYREGGPASSPILTSVVDVTAYAAYRMPATYAAVRTALTQVAAAAPQLRPVSQLDIGGGTGAAGWAAAETFATLAELTVVDQVPAALALGRSLAANAFRPVLRAATWRQGQLGPDPLAAADLVTVSYVIGELADPAPLLRQAATLGEVLVVIEPGTPAGFERIRAARDVLLDAGLRVIAPCPHQATCPIVAGRDWCHFGARIGRSALHRRLKGGELSYEDEKFSYVAAVRATNGATPGRVLRRPQQRKGLVSMALCAADGTIRPELVSKRQGDLYRAARDIDWGDAWPPAG